MHLDIRTAFYFTALTAFLSALGMTAVRWHHPGLGTKEWTRASWCMVFASILLFFRGPLPETWALPIAHALILASTVSYYAAIRSFKGKPFPRAMSLASVLVAPMFSAYYLSAAPNHPGRFAFMLLTKGAWDLASARELLYADHKRPSAAQFLTGLGFLFVALTVIFRVGYGIAYPQVLSTVTTSSYPQDLIFAAYQVLVLLGFGFILMLNEKANSDLHRLATLDSLTESFNRRTIEDLLRKEEARSRRSGSELGLLMVDIDHFKWINDHHGHHVGDDVLRQLVSTMGRHLRTHDSLGRFGGEEFLVVLPDTTVEEAAAVAERLRAAVAAEKFASRGLTMHVTVSIGVAMLSGMAATEPLVVRADQAMYEAKGRGRNRVVLLGGGVRSPATG